MVSVVAAVGLFAKLHVLSLLSSNSDAGSLNPLDTDLLWLPVGIGDEANTLVSLPQ